MEVLLVSAHNLAKLFFSFHRVDIFQAYVYFIYFFLSSILRKKNKDRTALINEVEGGGEPSHCTHTHPLVSLKNISSSRLSFWSLARVDRKM